jgi:hypothetical protein
MCRSVGGSITPITEWLQCADHALAPLCRSSTGSYVPVGDSSTDLLSLRGCTRAAHVTCWTRPRRGCRFRNPACALTNRSDAFVRLTERCALRLPSGESPTAYPRRAMLGAPRRPPNRLCRLGQTPAATPAAEPASRCLRHEGCPGHGVHRLLKSGRPRPRRYGRARCRAAHRATCGVSPHSGFHRSLAPLG